MNMHSTKASIFHPRKEYSKKIVVTPLIYTTFTILTQTEILPTHPPPTRKALKLKWSQTICLNRVSQLRPVENTAVQILK